MLRQSTADRFLGVLGQSTADPEVERQHHFNIFMAITILLTIGIYFGAYWIGHALWAGEMPEDQGVTGPSTDGLPWTPFNALSDAPRADKGQTKKCGMNYLSVYGKRG